MEPRSEDDDDFVVSGVRLLSSTRRAITTLLEIYGPQLSARPCSTHEAVLFNSFSQLLQMMRSMSFSASRAANLIVDVPSSSQSMTIQTSMPSSEPTPSATVVE